MGGSDEDDEDEGGITLAGFCAIGFFWVSGGSYGNEALVLSSPPGQLLFGVSIVGLCYGIPMALITAELGTAWPVAGGMAQWVEIGLGEIIGAHNAWWIWVSFIFDAAIYPVLASEYLATFMHWQQPDDNGNCDETCESDQRKRHIYASFVVFAMTLVKMGGRDFLEKISTFLAFATMTPSFIYIFTALFSGYFDVPHLTSWNTAACEGGRGPSYGHWNGSTNDLDPHWSATNLYPKVTYEKPNKAECGHSRQTGVHRHHSTDEPNCSPTRLTNCWNSTANQDRCTAGKGSDCKSKSGAPECWTEVSGCKSCSWNGKSCEGTDYALLLSFIMWLYAGFLSLGTLAGELEDPAGTYINAILVLTPVVLFINCFPLIVSMSIDHNRNNFHPGHFQTLATHIVGPWMNKIYFLGSQISLYGLYNSTVIMAECTMPPFFEKYFAYMGFAPDENGEYRSPMHNFFLKGKSGDEPGKFYIWSNMLVAIVLVWMPYQFLVEVTMLLMVIMTYPFLIAFLWLRHTQPEVERPFQLGNSMCVAFIWAAIPGIIGTTYLGFAVFGVDQSFGGKYNYGHINLNVWMVLLTVALGLLVQFLYTNFFQYCKGAHRGKKKLGRALPELFGPLMTPVAKINGGSTRQVGAGGSPAQSRYMDG